jgi:hypothetical protein
VRGTKIQFVETIENAFDDTVCVRENIVVPKTKDQISHRLNGSGSGLIALERLCMMTTVHFNDEMRGLATEVDDISTERHLTAEF